MLKYFPWSREPMDVCVLEGREAILAEACLLEAFAERCAQPGAMHWLEYFLSGRKARFKQPYLVLLLRAEADRSALQASDVLGAVLYFEYRFWQLRTGAFSTDDMSGLRTAVAPADQRARVAAIAAEALVEHGAHVVLTSFEMSEADELEPSPPSLNARAVWASRERFLGKHLPLRDTFAATMTTLGKRTRTHMRYYQRRLRAKSGCTFHADACRMLSEADFAAANARALNPVCAEECALRYASSCSGRGGFLYGLRAADGEWLSLAGGWRQAGSTVLQWQINAAGHERDSLRTAMRTYMLEHEVSRGAERLVFYGGTSHSMHHSFAQEQVRDLVLRRRTLRAWLLVRLSKLVEGPNSFTGRSNFMAATLNSPELLPQGEMIAARADSAAPQLPRVQLALDQTEAARLRRPD